MWPRGTNLFAGKHHSGYIKFYNFILLFIYLLCIYLYKFINYFQIYIADENPDFVPDVDEEEHYENGNITTRLPI